VASAFECWFCLRKSAYVQVPQAASSERSAERTAAGFSLTTANSKEQAMSHFLDRLTFFRKNIAEFSDGHGAVSNEDRSWEDAYRNRWQHDKVVRSTHGVNCTGSCSWKIYVKNGLITWEIQQTDYPRTRPDLPNHEPRGCPRGASYSWYVYSAQRVSIR
jgi:nitrate reductase alpha subunit